MRLIIKLALLLILGIGSAYAGYAYKEPEKSLWTIGYVRKTNSAVIEAEKEAAGAQKIQLPKWGK